MTIFGALYKIFIGPLELFFEIIFVIANRLIGNLGLSIIVLSLVMNFLVLPLYKRADAMQEEQRETENRLKKWVTHIKKTFKGDERFMMLQTYYRQNNYKPTSILKGSVSLLLEIPFFIAAYNFLSHAGVFDGFAFGPFIDMGQPDGLIKIGSLSINLLPILMTAINIVSSIIYTKGLPTSSKVQLYGMAGIFLVLLYNSPAALVFYWTLNNLFSLVKNLFYKLKNPKFVFAIISTIVGIIALVFDIVHPFNTFKKNFFVIAFSLLLLIPLVLYLLKGKIKLNISSKTKVIESHKSIFYLSVFFLTILTGILIPSSVIYSSPEEFLNVSTLLSPLNLILNSFLISFGFFVIWFSIFYNLAAIKEKKYMENILSIFSISALITYLFFGKQQSSLSPLLKFEKGYFIPSLEIFINLIMVLLVSIIVILVLKNKKIIIQYILGLVLISSIVISFYNCGKINSISKNKIANLSNNTSEEIKINLSRHGQNVLIFMMDRAINSYIPFIFNEKPEIESQFAGFTYYPNTISFGPCTNIGLPGVFGGYEYTPCEMNKRNKELLEDKHNEAMKVLPVLFSENGFDTTVCDPSYAGYDWIPDLSIYDDYPKIKKYITMDGSFNDDKDIIEKEKTELLNRNFFMYSLVKIVPSIFSETIYNAGNYNSIKSIVGQTTYGMYKASGVSPTFVNSFEVISNLNNIINIEDSNSNSFMIMCNDTTHSPCLLQEPDYIPLKHVDNTEYETKNKDRFTLNNRTMKVDNLIQMEHYQVNMAAMIQLGKFFDYLRKEGIYDNTKIIIVSDHGYNSKQFEDLILGEDYYEDIMQFNPLLLVKDFNSKDFSIDYSFMTNADVPSLAVKDVIENPINPFTNKVITNTEKLLHDQHILISYEWHTNINNGTTFIKAPWYAVHDNIFDLNNWQKIEE